MILESGLCCQKAFKGLRCVLSSALDVVVMKGHDCVIGSHTGLQTMFSAGTAVGATAWVVGDDGGADFTSMWDAEAADDELYRRL